MPVPLTSACLVFAAILLPVSEIAAAIVGGLGVANQAFVEIAAVALPRDES